MRAFWIVFCVLCPLLALLTVGAAGHASIFAILIQVGCIAYFAAMVLHARDHRAQYVVAAVGVALFWLFAAAQVGYRLFFWLTVGMEAADGTGSPVAFLIGFVFEQMVFVPLTFLGVVLVHYKPWRNAVEPIAE